MSADARGPSRRRMLNAVAKALHEEHQGQVAQGFERYATSKWQDCPGCNNASKIAVDAVERLWKTS